MWVWKSIGKPRLLSFGTPMFKEFGPVLYGLFQFWNSRVFVLNLCYVRSVATWNRIVFGWDWEIVQSRFHALEINLAQIMWPTISPHLVAQGAETEAFLQLCFPYSCTELKTASIHLFDEGNTEHLIHLRHFTRHVISCRDTQMKERVWNAICNGGSKLGDNKPGFPIFVMT